MRSIKFSTIASEIELKFAENILICVQTHEQKTGAKGKFDALD